MQKGDSIKNNLQQFDELIVEIKKLEDKLNITLHGLKLIAESNDPVGIARTTLDEIEKIKISEDANPEDENEGRSAF
tara:strand:+ start:719 stop:949 length:231 start_codon:yes stop_codon:yes gene_type:complete